MDKKVLYGVVVVIVVLGIALVFMMPKDTGTGKAVTMPVYKPVAKPTTVELSDQEIEELLGKYDFTMRGEPVRTENDDGNVVTSATYDLQLKSGVTLADGEEDHSTDQGGGTYTTTCTGTCPGGCGVYGCNLCEGTPNCCTALECYGSGCPKGSCAKVSMLTRGGGSSGSN